MKGKRNYQEQKTQKLQNQLGVETIFFNQGKKYKQKHIIKLINDGLLGFKEEVKEQEGAKKKLALRMLLDPRRIINRKTLLAQSTSRST